MRRRSRLSLISSLSIALAAVMAVSMACAVLTGRPSPVYVEARP